MATRSKKSIDLRAIYARYANQFKGLNTSDPASWPLVPRVSLFLGVAVIIVAALWLLVINSSVDVLRAEQEKEVQLKTDYTRKLGQAINLEELRRQREQVLQYVTQLEKQLPGKSEMDALLSDINQAGLGRGLTFELFRPGQVSVKEYYAELPIALRVTGRYHDVGSFTADIANLSRIVTLSNLVIVPAPNGVLAMDAVAKTFRYLDPEEVNAQRKTQGGPRR